MQGMKRRLKENAQIEELIIFSECWKDKTRAIKNYHIVNGGKEHGKIYFTIAGTKHYYGQEFFEAKQEVKLIKDPDNEFDIEAIKVEMDGVTTRRFGGEM